MPASLDDLISVSREYGSDPRWVVAGGGNTSLKDGDILYVKASGFPLATIGEEGFARMDRMKLAAIWEKTFPSGGDAESVAARERLVLADMMASRVEGEERRPSVETQLHDLLPWPLVVHLHPTLVNGLTCGADGPSIAADLFGDVQMWIPVTDPGYVLAKAIRDRLKERTAAGLNEPDFIFLANHGVFVGGRGTDEIREKYTRLDEVLSGRISRQPGSAPLAADLPSDEAGLLGTAREFFGDDAQIQFVAGGELDRRLATPEAARALTGCLTPDHIVYAGPGALRLEGLGADIAAAWKEAGDEYREYWGKPANVILLPEHGSALVAAAGETALLNAKLLLENALDVAAYTESFGGPSLMEERFVRFIVDWEVENYRSSMASK